MKQPFFSIIITVYNVEKYLERAVNSIIKQTYENFEVLLVDDKSTDASLAVCAAFQNKDKRVKLVSLGENSGPGRARNAGLAQAQGEYILFIDGDDYVDLKLLSHIKSCLESNETEVAILGIVEHYEDSNGLRRKSITILPHQTVFLASKEEVRNQVLCLQKNTLFRYVCNKVYKRSVLQRNQLWFRDFNISGDVDFNIRVFAVINNLALLRFAGYHYVHRCSNSITSKYVPNYFAIHMGLLSDRERQFAAWHKQEEARPYLLEEFVRYTFLSLQMTYYPQCDKRKSQQDAILKQVYISDFYKMLRVNETELGIKYRLLSLLLQTRNKILIIFTAISIYILKNKLIWFWLKIK